ncbi:MAG: hypothetical protein WC012_14240 [Thiohalomonadaceae bacterium]
MTTEHLFRFLIQSYLSPVLLLFYLFCAQGFLAPFGIRAFASTGTNSERLMGMVYLLVAPVIGFSWLMVSCGFLQSFDAGLSLPAILEGDIHWLQAVGFLVTAFVLRAYLSRNGVEANLMGFIFTPLLLFGAAISASLHFWWIWSVVLGGDSG